MSQRRCKYVFDLESHDIDDNDVFNGPTSERKGRGGANNFGCVNSFHDTMNLDYIKSNFFDVTKVGPHSLNPLDSLPLFFRIIFL